MTQYSMRIAISGNNPNHKKAKRNSSQSPLSDAARNNSGALAHEKEKRQAQAGKISPKQRNDGQNQSQRERLSINMPTSRTPQSAQHPNSRCYPQGNASSISSPYQNTTRHNKSRQQIIQRIAAIVFAMISAFISTFAFSFEKTGDILSFYYNTPLQFCIFAISAYTGYKVARDIRKPLSLSAFAVAFIFMLASFFGMLIVSSDGSLAISTLVFLGDEIDFYPVIDVIAVLIMLGFLVFYYCVVLYLYNALPNLPSAFTRAGTPFTALKIPVLGSVISYPVLMTVFVLCWMPYIVSYAFCGSFTTDTSRQLAQFFGVIPLDTHFPYFISLLFGGLYQIGCIIDPSGYLGVALMDVSQVIFGAFVFSAIIVCSHRLAVRKSLIVFFFCFFAFVPLIPAMLVCASKDTIHSLLIALLCLQVILYSLNRRGACEKFSLSSPAGIAVVAISVCLTRNNGIMLVFALLVFLCVLYRDKFIIIASICVISFALIWQLAIIPACGVASEGYREMVSAPVQTIAAVAKSKGDELSDSAKELMENRFNAELSELIEGYDPELSDNMKEHVKTYTLDDVLALLDEAGQISAEDPIAALSGAIATTYGSWYPFCDGSYFQEDFPYFTQESEWTQSSWFASCEDMETQSQAHEGWNGFFHAMHYMPIISFLYTPGIYTWFVIFLIGYSLRAGKYRKMTICLTSMFAILTIVNLLAPCASLRYALPFVMALPIFILDFAYIGKAMRESDHIAHKKKGHPPYRLE